MGLAVLGDASVDAGGISFGLADGSPELAYAGQRISWAEVRDVDPGAAPPEVRTVDGRTVFVDARRRDALADAARAAGVAIVERPDVWDRLLQPFLDTDMPGWAAEADAQLVGWGFTVDEIGAIRAEVGAYVGPYALLMLEWVHLGVCDLIEARFQLDEGFAASRDEYVRWRRWIDGVADRGRD